MRLIDADELIINLYHNKKVVMNDDLVKCIDDTETTYSVDKVVEDVRCRCYEMGLDESQTEIVVSEIVKQGGVADDVCEWKQTSTARYKTSCGYKLEEYFDTNACYCKQCGKKIKVVE